MSTVANLRRRTPEPPAWPPEVGQRDAGRARAATGRGEAQRTRRAGRPLPAGRWTGERAATNILALARKAPGVRLAGNPAPPAARQTGVLYGGALALTAAILTWSGDTGAPVQDPDKRRDPLTAGLPFPSHLSGCVATTTGIRRSVSASTGATSGCHSHVDDLAELVDPVAHVGDELLQEQPGGRPVRPPSDPLTEAARSAT